MKKKKSRVQLIVELINGNCISSQSELCEMLLENDVEVTQATLSRDLKTLRATKVPTENGGYMYIIPDSNEIHNKMLEHGQASSTAAHHVGPTSIEFSGNFAVIKTRNGYATGLAYDIDMSHSHEILGTIAGADTVFAILREGVTHDEAKAFFARFIS
ncbi:MAG: arginine repressor [Bacteroidales bacterium]|uniref:arginine repressor n=1 Tax=Sodaliphilus sp. TaxID=2815818 RepID=UPI001B4321F0|nr:arginine repressor [Candidatus Sodaliphilus limicaballi]